MYKKAAQLKLRFLTKRGELCVEDLFGLSLKSLEIECRDQLKRMKDSGSGKSEELDFLEENNTTDPIEELRFEILKDVYKTKKAEIASVKKAAETRQQKQKLLEILQKKQQESLENLSEEEILKKLKELDEGGTV